MTLITSRALAIKRVLSRSLAAALSKFRIALGYLAQRAAALSDFSNQVETRHMLSTTGDTLSWYVVHTHPKQEDRTTINLQVLGIETLSPKLRVKRYNQFTGQLIRAVKPLFPSYVFARFKFNDSYHRVRFAKGAHSLVSFNNRPTPVDEEIVNLIRSRIGSDGFVNMREELKAGDEVVINEGRFQNFCGIFEREMEDADRVCILLNTVSFQAHVVVDRVLVNKIPQEKRSRVA